MIMADTCDLPHLTKQGDNLQTEEGYLQEENLLTTGVNMLKRAEDLRVKAGHHQTEDMEDRIAMVGILHTQRHKNGLTLHRGTDIMGNTLHRERGDILHRGRGDILHRETKEMVDILHIKTRGMGDILHRGTTRAGGLQLGPVWKMEESLQ